MSERGRVGWISLSNIMFLHVSGLSLRRQLVFFVRYFWVACLYLCGLPQATLYIYIETQ